MNPIRLLLIVTVIATAFPQTSIVDGDEPSRDHSWADVLVEKLGHQSYQARQRARRDLESLGPTAEVRAALAAGLRSKSLEVRQTARAILQQFEFTEFNHQLAHLNNTDSPANDIQLAGWKEFSQLADTGYWSRQLFAKLARQYPTVLREISQSQGAVYAARSFVQRADPYRLHNDDSVRWALLLLCDSTQLNLQRPDLSSRILQSLTHSGLGPTQVSPGDRQVIQHLIKHWIKAHPDAGTVRSQLLVAMRYECRSLASELTATVFADESALAAAQATAMLCAGVLRSHDLQFQLRKRLFDERTAHEWQLIASRKTRIRTQVRDVALALLLHQHDIDPRTVGFEELQADPLMVYRDHSLGFASDEQREAAHAKGRLQLGL